MIFTLLRALSTPFYEVPLSVLKAEDFYFWLGVAAEEFEEWPIVEDYLHD